MDTIYIFLYVFAGIIVVVYAVDILLTLHGIRSSIDKLLEIEKERKSQKRN